MATQSGFPTTLDEFRQSVTQPGVWLHLGLSDIVGRYRRTLIGPFWLTLSSAILIASVGLLYAGLFQSPLDEYIPFLAMGLIVWQFINSTILDGANVFIQSAVLVRSTPMPLITHVLRMMWRNIIIMAHNIVVVALVWLVFQWMPSAVAWLAIPGLLLNIIFLFGISLIFGVLCTRFRDVPQILTAVMTLLFLLTPIMWQPQSIRGARFVLEYNPIHYFIEIVRAPLLGEAPQANEWIVASASAGAALVIGLIVFAAYRKRIAYWL